MKPLLASAFWVLTALLLLPSLSSGAQWQKKTIETTTKSSVVKTIWTVNDDGHRLRFLRGRSGPVYAAVHLSESAAATFGTREPRYQVDDGPLRLLADYGPFLDMSSKTAEWPVWDGPQPPCADAPVSRWREAALCEILQGRRVEFEYVTVTGERRQTAFSLENLRPIIEEFLF